MQKKEIADMLKKDAEVMWTTTAREYFTRIKEYFQEAPIMLSPYYENPFQIFSFASSLTLATILLQRNQENREEHVAFFSRVLRDAALKYNILEKQAYDLVKALNPFRVYILPSQIVAYVPNTNVKDALTQSDSDGKRGKWIARIQEYDMEIKPTKMVKGQGL